MSSLGGIFSGMKSYPDSEQVLDDLGDKVNDAFVESIDTDASAAGQR